MKDPFMDRNYIVLAAIAVGLVVVALVIGALTRGRRHKELKSKFGPEYDRTVAEVGKRGKAEKELVARAKRVETFTIRPLPPADRDRFAQLWRTAQSHFVDSPVTAVTEAAQLLGEVMRARGYPVSEFEQRAADLSVDHPVFVDHYRRGHALAVGAHEGKASTEDLRQAMVHYRALFEELLQASVAEVQQVPEPVTH
jgi:hypothetical protein